MKKRIKEVGWLILIILIINTSTVEIVLSGHHVSPNTVIWFDGFLTFMFVNAILNKFDIYLKL